MSSNIPSHYARARRIQPHGLRWTPEHNLVAAMLTQAISDRCWGWYWRDARDWVAAMSEQPFGFAWCCRQIDQDPETVRAAIVEQWKERPRHDTLTRGTHSPPPI